jgi:hypothetical protein
MEDVLAVYTRPHDPDCPLVCLDETSKSASGEQRRGATPSIGSGEAPFQSSFVCDDLFQALDAIIGEGRHAILTDVVDAQAAVFGEHVDR